MLEEFYRFNPYALEHEDKNALVTRHLIDLTEHHRNHCTPYANLLTAMEYDPRAVKTTEDIPFFPVRLFKEMELLSIDRRDIFKIMTSSGTAGQAVSRIYVDRDNAMAQQKVMIKILSDYFGKQRLPLLIVDSPAVLKDRQQFSARGAAIMGLQFMTRDNTYALDSEMNLDFGLFESFLNRNKGKPFLIFGFTFMIWQHFYLALKASGKKYDLSDAWLMSGGGWKKLQSAAVSQEDFRRKMSEETGIKHFLDHYNMVEQTGCLYAECEFHHLHASIFSDVIVRRSEDLSPCEIGEKGIIELLSVLPRSYPGHALLTEDEGIILGEDDCPCGRKGKYIRVLGRLKAAELRGCSDTYAAKC